MEDATRHQLEDFLVDYAHVIDDGDLARWPQMFTEDGTYQIIPKEALNAGQPLGVMLCKGRGMLADRVTALEEANIYEPHAYCHILGQPRFCQGEDGSIGARSNFHVIRTMQDGRMETFAAGKYLDIIVFEDGKPLFKERRVVLESRRVDILLVFPL